jgi:hypothetical protein
MMELQQDFGTMMVSIVNVWHFVNMFFWILAIRIYVKLVVYSLIYEIHCRAWRVFEDDGR